MSGFMTGFQRAAKYMDAMAEEESSEEPENVSREGQRARP